MNEEKISEVTKELLEEIRNWSENHSTPEKKMYKLGRKMYSPKELYENIRDGTPVGMKHARMIIRLACRMFERARKK